MLLDEVEPDGGLVGDVLDHPVYAVLHCAATTSPQGICKKEKKTRKSARCSIGIHIRGARTKREAGDCQIGGLVYRGGSRRRGRVATTTRRRRRRRKRGDGACPRPPVGDHHGLAASARRGARICRRSQRRRPIRGWEIEIWGSLSLMGEEEAEEQTNYCAQLQLPTGQLLTPLKNLPVHFYWKTN